MSGAAAALLPGARTRWVSRRLEREHCRGPAAAGGTRGLGMLPGPGSRVHLVHRVSVKRSFLMR